MPTFSGLAQLINSPPCYHLSTVRKENRQHVFQIQQTRAPIHQRNHVHTKRVLKLGLLVKVVQNHLGDLAPLELNHHPHTRLVRLIANVRNALYAFFIDQLCNLLLQRLFVHLIREFINDNGLTVTALFNILNMRAGAHNHPPPPGTIPIMHPRKAKDEPRSWEIRCFNNVD